MNIEIKDSLIVGNRYMLRHNCVGNKCLVFTETLQKIVRRKDGNIELRFTNSRRTFYPISPKKQYGIISIMPCSY